MTAPLVQGEATICHQVKIPESLDRRLRARAVLEGDLPISRVIRSALEAYLGPVVIPVVKGDTGMKATDRCPDCDLPLASESEFEDSARLCWRLWHGDVCQGVFLQRTR